VLVPSLMIGGLGTGLFNPAGAAVALGSVPPEQSGLASGVQRHIPPGRESPSGSRSSAR
jgi:hypothetical protein